MKGEKIIGLLLVVMLTACSTTQQVPIDDIYYWPTAQETGQSTPNNPNTQNTPSSQNTPSTPSQPSSTIEYVNVQDTTVTIRIKK